MIYVDVHAACMRVCMHVCTPARACAHRKGSRAWKVSMARVRVHGSSSGARRYCEKMAVACSELDE